MALLYGIESIESMLCFPINNEIRKENSMFIVQIIHNRIECISLTRSLWLDVEDEMICSKSYTGLLWMDTAPIVEGTR